MTIGRQSIYFGGGAQFGDGKPVILVPELGSNLFFLLLSDWLKVLGYRPVTASRGDPSITDLIRATAKRIGRKAVLVAPASGTQIALRLAAAHKDFVSDIVLLNASQFADTPAGVRAHFIASGWSLLAVTTALPQLLRSIRIELIDAPSPSPIDTSPIC